MTTFSHFGPEHIGMLITIAVIVAAGLLITRRSSGKNAQRTALILAVITLAAELFQDFLLVREGGNIINFLPLHLCNIGIFVNLLAALTKAKFQSYFAEVSLVLIAPGSLGALLFPDWTYRPLLSTISILCFLTHTLLVFIPLMYLVRKSVRVSFKHFWYSYLFLALVVPPIRLLNEKAGQNYMYLMYPPKSSPLEWIYNQTGDTYYTAGLVLFITVLLLLEYLVYFLAAKASKK